jgi:hypothetical protein
LFKGKPTPFFQAPTLKVRRTTSKESTRQPRTEINLEEAYIICLKLAKAGYGGGNPETIGQMSPDWVIKILDYENFCGDWEEEYLNLNKKDG